MKTLTSYLIVPIACSVLALTSFGGPEPVRDYKETKNVAPMPLPECNWTGFYIGLNAGGQFGNSENKDLDDWIILNQKWSYSESGFVGGGQIGYNYQWRWLVVGLEADGGYMNLDGKKFEPNSGQDTFGETDSDFFTTIRGKVGFAHDCWLFYATGGGIGVNYEKRVADPDVLNVHNTNFDWGYTLGGGIERMFGRHWSVKLEYLYFNLGNETFSGRFRGVGEQFRWQSDTDGHIVRAGLNYHF